MFRACLKIGLGAAAGDFGCGQGGEAGASPQRALTAEPTQSTGKRPAARRVFAEKAVWLRCFSVEDTREIFSFVAPRHTAFSAKTAPSRIFRQALKRTKGWLLLLVLLAGCESPKSPLVNWNDRVGNYTYNLALQDLGQPLHSTTLGNGSIVADWRIQKSTPGTPDTSEAEGEGGYALPVLTDNLPPLTAPPTPNRYLRLTFGPDGKLTDWKKYSQYHQP